MKTKLTKKKIAGIAAVVTGAAACFVGGYFFGLNKIDRPIQEIWAVKGSLPGKPVDLMLIPKGAKAGDPCRSFGFTENGAKLIAGGIQKILEEAAK